MNPNLLKRRTEMLDAVKRGINPAAVIEQLASNYKVSTQCLWSDWKRRDQWAPVLLGLERFASFGAEVESKLNLVEKGAWSIYTHTDNPNAKVGALKVVIDSLKTQSEIVVSRDVLVRLERLEGCVEKKTGGK